MPQLNGLLQARAQNIILPVIGHRHYLAAEINISYSNYYTLFFRISILTLVTFLSQALPTKAEDGKARDNAATNARADARESYVVEGLEVTLEDNLSPVRAREKAVSRATKLGFGKLLKRLTAPNSAMSHKEIIAQADLQRALDSFNLTQEETDPDYKAVFNLRYSRGYVRDLLSRLSVPFSEVGAGSVLLLPIMDLGQDQLLWEETNPWRAKLKEAAKEEGLVKFVLPVGDPQEMMMLTPEMVAFGAGDMIMRVAENYNADAAVVARFQMGMAPDGGREALLDLTWYGEQGIAPKYLQIPLEKDKGLDAAMTLIATQAISAVENAWRQLYMVDFDRPGQTLLHYAAKNASQLQDVRDTLRDIAIVDSVPLRAVSSDTAALQVNYFGTEDKLIKLASEKDMTILPWNQKLIVSLGGDGENADAYGARAVLRARSINQSDVQPAELSPEQRRKILPQQEPDGRVQLPAGGKNDRQ